MIYVIYGNGMNWFYRRLAERVAVALSHIGVSCVCVSARDVVEKSMGAPSDSAIFVSYHECMHSVSNLFDYRDRFLLRTKEFERRILFNADSIHTVWFRRNFEISGGSITDIIDYAAVPQTMDAQINNARYHWLSASLNARELDTLPYRTENRPIPWAVVGMHTPERADLVARLAEEFDSKGFVFLPPLAAANARNRRLLEEHMNRLLSQTNYYIWCSHHSYYFDEFDRVFDALRNGAIPVKIGSADPQSDHRPPYLFPDLRTFMTNREREGDASLFEATRREVRARGSLEDALKHLWMTLFPDRGDHAPAAGCGADVMNTPIVALPDRNGAASAPDRDPL
jgi:hypothetical protein